MPHPRPHQDPSTRSGKAGWALLAWLVGIPLPIILIFLLMGSCT